MPKNNKEDSRLREIAALVARHRLHQGITPQKLRALVEDLGPTYVKLGQILSLRQDLLPEEYCRELARLQVQARPMPFDQARLVMEEAFGRPLEEVFSAWEEAPLGAASMAQVHRAWLRDGRAVAVKVQRPGIGATMAQDIALLRRLAGLTKLTGLQRTVDLNMVLDEMWQAAQQELDFLQEAANAAEFRQNCKELAYAGCPAVFREYTTARVLVMEYVGGIPIDDGPALAEQGYVSQEIGLKLANHYIKQVLEDGFFHGDPHPGNLRIAEGRIIWLDMGMMGRITPKDRALLGQALLALAKDDPAGLESVVVRLCSCRGTVDHEALQQDLASFLARYGRQALGSISLGQAMGEMMSIARRHGLAMPPGISLLARGMVQLEGLLAQISPELDLMEILAARLKEELRQRMHLGQALEKGTRLLLESGWKAAGLPGQVSDLLRSAAQGQAIAQVKLGMAPGDARDVRRGLRLLCQCLLLVGLFVGSCLLCATPLRPRLWGVPALGLCGVGGSLVWGLWLLWKMGRSKD